MSRDEWVAKYQAGATLEELAMAAGVALDTVRRNLLKQGVVIRPRARRPGHPNSANPNRNPMWVAVEFAKKYRSGATIQQIAKETGASLTHVRRVLLSQGVTMCQPGRRARA